MVVWERMTAFGEPAAKLFKEPKEVTLRGNELRVGDDHSIIQH